ncbi:MAG TPA: SDR family oxidoreductase [Chitinophagaceae bacterium]|nr:SDR family oxidoreductase [Chitinophagaceae bacterium]
MPTALILGATSDMAIAIARKFASHGYNIQLAARNTTPLQALQSDISIRHNVQCTVHTFDALNYASHKTFMDQLNPKPDVTICVFGYLGDATKARTDWQEAERILHTNYTGAVSVLDRIADHYAAQKQGTIVGISSVAGERGRQSNYHYGSAKAGFTAYLSGLRNRLFKDGVHVVTVQPGFVYTRMTENLQLPKLLTGHPTDVANTVYSAVKKKKNVVYVKWFWRWLMLIIRSIPEFMFKKMKL